MKSILGGFAVAILLALGAYYVFEGTMQQTAESAFTTPSARPPGQAASPG